MFGLGQKKATDDEALPAEQVKRLQALEANALWAHMQLSELLKTIRHPSPFELAPAMRRIEMAESALIGLAREIGLV